MQRVQRLSPLKTPRCEVDRKETYYSDTHETERRCQFRARYVIDGVMMCQRHAALRALEILCGDEK